MNSQANIIVIGILIITINASLYAQEGNSDYKSKGPSKLSELKNTLHDKLPIYERGIWPESKAFEKVVNEKDIKSDYIHKLKTWMPIILNKSVLPDRLESTQLYGIPKLHEGGSFVIGQYYSPIGNILVQYQANGVDMAVTATSEKYFSTKVKSISDGEIIDMIRRLTNYPIEKVKNIVIEKHIEEVGDNDSKVLLCYGKIRCDGFNEMKAPTAENVRTWWNYVPFWIVDGTISINTTTVKWETYPSNLTNIFFGSLK